MGGGGGGILYEKVRAAHKSRIFIFVISFAIMKPKTKKIATATATAKKPITAGPGLTFDDKMSPFLAVKGSFRVHSKK